MLSYFILYCVMLCYVMLCDVMLCYVMPGPRPFRKGSIPYLCYCKNCHFGPILGKTNPEMKMTTVSHLGPGASQVWNCRHFYVSGGRKCETVGIFTCRAVASVKLSTFLRVGRSQVWNCRYFYVSGGRKCETVVNFISYPAKLSRPGPRPFRKGSIPYLFYM